MCLAPFVLVSFPDPNSDAGGRLWCYLNAFLVMCTIMSYVIHLGTSYQCPVTGQGIANIARIQAKYPYSIKKTADSAQP